MLAEIMILNFLSYASPKRRKAGVGRANEINNGNTRLPV